MLKVLQKMKETTKGRIKRIAITKALSRQRKDFNKYCDSCILYETREILKSSPKLVEKWLKEITKKEVDEALSQRTDEILEILTRLLDDKQITHMDFGTIKSLLKENK